MPQALPIRRWSWSSLVTVFVTLTWLSLTAFKSYSSGQWLINALLVTFMLGLWLVDWRLRPKVPSHSSGPLPPAGHHGAMNRLGRTMTGAGIGLCAGLVATVGISYLFETMFPVPDLDEFDMYRDEVLAMMFSGEYLSRFTLISAAICGLTGLLARLEPQAEWPSAPTVRNQHFRMSVCPQPPSGCVDCQEF